MSLYDKLIKSAKLSEKTTEPSRDELVREMHKKRLEAELERVDTELTRSVHRLAEMKKEMESSMEFTNKMEKAFLVVTVVIVGAFIVTLLGGFLFSPA